MRKIIFLAVIFLLAFGSNLWAQVDISGKWTGTCVSSSSGNTYNAEADLSQTGSDVSGTITVDLGFTQMVGEVAGTVSDSDFTGTWDEGSEDCPDPTPFEYEISTDGNMLTGWLIVRCPGAGFDELNYEDFILVREGAVVSTTTTTVGSQVDISGKWTGTCVSANSGSKYPAEADLSQSGNDVTGNIAMILSDGELEGEVAGTVSDSNFTGTWNAYSENCPDPTPFEYEISQDGNTMTGQLQVKCPGMGFPEITFKDFVLERGGASSTTTTASSSPCPAESVYGNSSDKTEFLRCLRDNVLSKTPEGQEIIRLYYEWSHVVVRTMEEDEEFKGEMKEMIDGILPMIRGEVE